AQGAAVVHARNARRQPTLLVGRSGFEEGDPFGIRGLVSGDQIRAGSPPVHRHRLEELGPQFLVGVSVPEGPRGYVDEAVGDRARRRQLEIDRDLLTAPDFEWVDDVREARTVK